MATNFTENFVQLNSPKNAYFPCYGGYIFLQYHRSGGGGNHESFDPQIGGSQKYKFMIPHSKENDGPLLPRLTHCYQS